MVHEIRYGKSDPLVLHFRDDLRVTDCAVPRGTPIDDVERAVRDALQTPYDFPALAVSVVAGDRVAIPVAPGVPQTPAIVAGLVRSLVDAGVSLKDITLVTPGKAKPETSDENESQSPLISQLPDAWRVELKVVTHDPAEFVALAYLAASKAGDPIYINRLLSDADIVIPIGTLRTPSAINAPNMYDDIFPAFSDRETQKRFRVSDGTKWETYAKRRQDEANEAGWWLGVQLTVQVVPGPGDSVLHVLTGNCESVFKHGQELARAAWRVDVPERAGVVVASISGGPDQQTWENFARALHSASTLVFDHGAIVLCTNLRCKPGPMLQRLSKWTVGDPLPQAMRRERTPDAFAAIALAEARQRSRVYLLSRMNSDVVEDLGIGYVASADEIERLTRQQELCVLLPSAQHAEVVVHDE